MYDRDFVTTAARSQTTFGEPDAGGRRRGCGKEFGANNFYGGNAPSREWTNQTLVSLNHRIGARGRMGVRGRGVVSDRTATGSSSTRRGRSCRTTGTEPTPRSGR